MGLISLLKTESTHQKALVEGQIVPDSARCVQCGVCSYHCPIGIDMRSFAWKGIPLSDSQCLTCGECVSRCPRGVLRIETTNLFNSRR